MIPGMWGTEPFRIGLWVGTDVSPKRYEEAKDAAQAGREGGPSARLTVLQFQRCPWCGTPISAANVRADDEHQRIYVYCGDELGDCPFSRDGDGRRRAAGPDGRRGDLPAGARVRHRDRRQVRPAGAGRRGGVALRLRVAEVRAARVRAPRLPGCKIQAAASTRQGRRYLPPRSPGQPAPAARPDHPGRAAPDHRRARHDGRACSRSPSTRCASWRDRGRPPGPAAARRVHRDRAERGRPGARPVRAGRDDLPAAGARRREDVLLQRAAGLRRSTPGGGTSASAPPGSGSPPPRSGWPRC